MEEGFIIYINIEISDQRIEISCFAVNASKMILWETKIRQHSRAMCFATLGIIRYKARFFERDNKGKRIAEYLLQVFI
jgi:hypothetical protein